jgi:hypothetical protein
VAGEDLGHSQRAIKRDGARHLEEGIFVVCPYPREVTNVGVVKFGTWGFLVLSAWSVQEDLVGVVLLASTKSLARREYTSQLHRDMKGSQR